MFVKNNNSTFFSKIYAINNFYSFSKDFHSYSIFKSKDLNNKDSRFSQMVEMQIL